MSPCSSSRNITVRAERFPKITVQRLAGSDSSVVDTNERTGVIPEPAAMAA